MSEKTIKIGAIGVGGRLTGVLTKLLEQSDKLKIVRICDPDPASLANCRERLSLPEGLESSQEALLADPEVEWVFIGSPNCYHPEQVIAAFEAGKNVFCEKPLGADTAVIPGVVKAWKESGKTFAFGLVLRYAPLYQECQRIISEGKLGKIVSFEFNETLTPAHGGYINGNWRRKREIAGTHLLEKCCHDLDICLWLIGATPIKVASFGGRNFFLPENKGLRDRYPKPKSGRDPFRAWPDRHGVDPFTGEGDIVDNQVVIMEFDNGVRGAFHTNCSANISERRFYICGTLGTLRADAATGIIEYKSLDPNGEKEVINISHAGGHAGGDEKMAAHLFRTLSEGTPPAASMREAVRSLITAGGIDHAMDTGTIYDMSKDWSESVGL